MTAYVIVAHGTREPLAVCFDRDRAETLLWNFRRYSPHKRFDMWTQVAIWE
jgi:hypothetical protein